MSSKLGPGGKQNLFFDVVIMAAVFAFLLCYFEPGFLFSKTVTTGGDTPSHYYTASFLKNHLLPNGRISGWCQGNLAGFPMLQNYFPLPFVVMSFLSWFMPLEIAFKIGTVLGTFLLPVATYSFFRLLRQPFPVPVTGAIFSLGFLFMQGNSMWGGNIPSTLAGTFCYSLGFSISILWLGLVYRCLTEKKGPNICAIVLALVGLCHGYTLLGSLFSALFFLITRKNFSQNLKQLLYIYTVAFCLMGFWIVPLMAFLPYTTRFSILWIFFTWGQIQREVFPVLLVPFAAITLAGASWLLFNRWVKRSKAPFRPWLYVGFLAFSGIALYFAGYRMGLVDIRFLPYLQFFLITGGALFWTLFTVSRPLKILGAIMLLLLTCLWVDSRETFIRNWIRSNYAGVETKPLWKAFRDVNRFLLGNQNSPRVVYEHSMRNEGAGTVRAFENLPLFSGRSTLEGVYIQASLCVPFIFYVQSEISQKPSTPIPDYCYSRFDLNKAHAHLKIFNVSEMILVEPETIAAATASRHYEYLARFGPYQVFRVLENTGHYVEPVTHRPVLLPTEDWRKISYEWFRLGNLSVPLVFKDSVTFRDRERFHILKHMDPKALPETKHNPSTPVREFVSQNEILIENATPCHPLLIKISYHPNWRVEGADGIYLASPAFMLIYPEKDRVRLYYGKSWPDHAGAFLSVLAIVFLILYPLKGLSRLRTWACKGFDRWLFKPVCGIMALVLLLGAYILIRVSPRFPVIPYNKGIEAFTNGDYRTAKVRFKTVLTKFPQTLIVDQAAYHYAMCYFREEDWTKALNALNCLMETYPETGRAAEVLYHMGLCGRNLGRRDEARADFHKTTRQFPKTIWAGFAKDRLKEMDRP